MSTTPLIINTSVLPSFHNFTLQKRTMMKQQTDIPETILNDEIIRFLADRYHTSPRNLLHQFFNQDDSGSVTESRSIQLEENEMTLLRDLINSQPS